MQVIKQVIFGNSNSWFTFQWIKSAFAFFIFLLVQTDSLSQSAVPEYQVKSIFLYNFAQFVEWPESSFQTEDSPFVIGIAGKDPFGNYLEETILNEKVNGHPMIIKRYKEIEEIDTKEIHILYVNFSKSEQLKSIFESFRSANTLTVGDAPNFTQEGGMIRFLTDNNKTKIQINLEVAKEANLTISSKLLRLAEIVSYPK
jgi:hypothetical protein